MENYEIGCTNGHDTYEPLVSVIVPVYNVIDYIREALDSAVNQTYHNLEILIVDDGSDDGSEIVCDEYREKDSRVRVIHQNNQGLSAARNVGLDCMTGDIIAFLDPDDAFHHDMIRQMVTSMQQNQAEIVICGITECHTTGRLDKARASNSLEYNKEEILCSRDALNALINGEICQAVWNKLYLRKFWDTLRFPDGCVYEDVSVTHTVLGAAERILTIPGIYVLHRIRSGSITQTSSNKNVRDLLSAHKQFEAFIRTHIPEWFDKQQLGKAKDNGLWGSIREWAKIPLTEYSSAKDTRREIIEWGKTVDKKSRSRRTSVAYKMLRFCPLLLSIIVPICIFVKSMIKKFIRR